MGHATEENKKGDQKVLQLGYKKLTYYVIYTVIFRHMLLQHQCIFSTFLLSCLCAENRFFCFDSNHAFTASVSDSSPVNQVI